MAQLFSNNASTTLAASLSDSATSLTVASSAGFDAITAPDFELSTIEAGALREIVKVTARSGTTWTVTRAQEGTTARAWDSGTKVDARLTAGSLDGMMQAASHPDVSGLDRGGNARGTGAINLQKRRSTIDMVASGSHSIAVGTSSKASANYASAVGGIATATAFNASAFGSYSIAAASRATALGSGSRARGERCTALNGSWTFADQAIGIWGFAALPAEDWNDQWEQNASGVKAAFATPYVDLAAPPAWAESTVVEHGDIVRPTAGGSVQYRAWCDYADNTWLHLTPTAGATEPTWPGSGGSVSINATDNAEWIGIDLASGYETTTFPDWLEFHPTEIVFVCQKYAATTGTPTVSIGIPGDSDLIVSAASVTISAAGQSFRFTLPNPCPGIGEGGSMLITLDSAASAGTMLGRFIVSGFFIETKSRA